jgi:pimeloyl-ACP methyl ester carboxylesterase
MAFAQKQAAKKEIFYDRKQFRASSGNMVEYIFFDRGKKKTLHFVDGWALRLSCWKWQMRGKDGDGLFKKYNLLFSNNRGHGDSELGDSTETTFLTDCARDRIELINGIGLHSVHLVAHSMGALIATQMHSMERKFDIPSIVFVTPAVCNPLRTFPWADLVKPILDLADDKVVREKAIAGMLLLLNSLTNPVTSWMYYSYFKIRSGSAVTFDSFRKYMEAILNADPEAFVIEFGSMLENGDKIGNKMKGIDCPVLAMIGHLDFLIAHKAVDMLKGYVPRTQTIVMPNTTHFPQAERPEMFNSILWDFLTSCKRI